MNLQLDLDFKEHYKTSTIACLKIVKRTNVMQKLIKNCFLIIKRHKMEYNFNGHQKENRKTWNVQQRKIT